VTIDSTNMAARPQGWRWTTATIAISTAMGNALATCPAAESFKHEKKA
jgi:hypothetical protein